MRCIELSLQYSDKEDLVLVLKEGTTVIGYSIKHSLWSVKSMAE